MPGTCRTSPRPFRQIVCWSRPIRRSLRPVPHRGKTCEPAFVADTAAFVAELRGENVDALGQTSTTTNFFRLFAKAAA